MAKGIHTESTFEEAIEESLLQDGGYIKGFFDLATGYLYCIELIICKIV